MYLLKHGKQAFGAGHFDPFLFSGLNARELPQPIFQDLPSTQD